MRQKITKTVLDLDGVIANFCKAARKAMNEPYPVDPFEIPDGWLESDDKKPLWKYCRGHDFWENIEPFPWAKRLIKLVDYHCQDWRFITKPSFDPGSYSGKYAWVNKHVKNGVKHLWLVNGSKAFACSGPNHLLIDDNAKNCEEWKAAGGTVYRWTEVSSNWPEIQIETRLWEIENLIVNGVND